jgi:conjugal transfer/entry exclusion protein
VGLHEIHHFLNGRSSSAASYGRGTSLQDLLRHSEAWREVERNAFVESHKLQSQIAEAMEAAAARDAATLDAAMAAPGIRAAIQAGNQLTGSLIAEVRTLQMAHIAHARAVETQQLRDTAADAQGRQAICDFFKDTPSARVSWCE